VCLFFEIIFQKKSKIKKMTQNLTGFLYTQKNHKIDFQLIENHKINFQSIENHKINFQSIENHKIENHKIKFKIK